MFNATRSRVCLVDHRELQKQGLETSMFATAPQTTTIRCNHIATLDTVHRATLMLALDKRHCVIARRTCPFLDLIVSSKSLRGVVYRSGYSVVSWQSIGSQLNVTVRCKGNGRSVLQESQPSHDVFSSANVTTLLKKRPEHDVHTLGAVCRL